MKYLEIIEKASAGELTVGDLNEIVLAINDREVEKDKVLNEFAIKLSKHDRGFRDIEEEYPLLPPEADDLSKSVKAKGVEVLGGKKSNAYADRELRSRVYRDIYSEIKREFGLVNERGGQLSYKKLKRKYLPGAFNVVSAYILPTALAEEIDAVNDIDLDD